MNLYTSYFDNLRKLSDNGIVGLSIALYPPAKFKIDESKCIRELAPTRSILQNWKDTRNIEIYRRQYYEEILNKLDSEEIMNDIILKSRGKDCALLCFEKSYEFCHRELVREWLKSYDYHIEEF